MDDSLFGGRAAQQAIVIAVKGPRLASLKQESLEYRASPHFLAIASSTSVASFYSPGAIVSREASTGSEPRWTSERGGRGWPA